MTMRFTSRWPAAVAVGLSLATLVVVGCTGRTPPSASVPAKADAVGSAATAAAKPMANWPDDLAGVLLISGDMLGYTEPCGCTKGQIGGLIRRTSLVDLLRTERKWPVALVDLGGLLNDPPSSHGGLDQTKIKFATILKALTMLKYSALGLSAGDLKIGADEALISILNNLPESPDAPKIVAANVTPAAGLGLESRFRKSVRIKLGTYDIGVTGVLDPKAFADLKDASKAEMLTVASPDDVLPGVLADLEKDTTLQVLMVQGPPELAKRLGLANPGFDVVVATTPFGEPETTPATLHGGATWLVTVGLKGQYVGAIGLPKDKSKPRLYQRVVLKDRYDSYKTRAEAMRKLIDEDFVAELKSADVVGRFQKDTYIHEGDPVAAEFVGAETCKSCHPNTYNVWAATKHAKAYEALTSDPKRIREADADCVRCHTTGFKYKGGFAGVEATPHLKGNQCENCHGPGSAHAAAPDDVAIRKVIARSREKIKDRCLDCHDEDNAPHGFEFDTMWAKVMHSKLDSYQDPAVHKGVVKKP